MLILTRRVGETLNIGDDVEQEQRGEDGQDFPVMAGDSGEHRTAVERDGVVEPAAVIVIATVRLGEMLF